MKHFACVSLLCLTTFLLGGCAEERPSDIPKLYPCKITVMQDGAPLADATVSLFQPNSVWTATGATDTKGVVAMRTNGIYPGAVPGRYKIMVSKSRMEESKLGPAPPETDPGFGVWREKAMTERLRCFVLVEPKFGKADSTPLEITIEEKTNAMSVDVGKAVQIEVKDR